METAFENLRILELLARLDARHDNDAAASDALRRLATLWGAL